MAFYGGLLRTLLKMYVYCLYHYFNYVCHSSLFLSQIELKPTFFENFARYKYIFAIRCTRTYV